MPNPLTVDSFRREIANQTQQIYISIDIQTVYMQSGNVNGYKIPANWHEPASNFGDSDGR